jgi:hypothetical protein
MQSSAIRLIAVALFALSTIWSPATVRAAIPPDTTKLEFTAFREPNYEIVPGEDFILEVRRWTEVGPLEMIAEVVDGALVPLGTPPWDLLSIISGEEVYGARLTVSSVTAGHHEYRAIFNAEADLEAVTLSLTVDVDRVDMTVEVNQDPSRVEAFDTVTLTAVVTGENAGVLPTGDVIWRDDDTGAVLPDPDASDTTVAITPTAEGTHHIRAEYSGDTTHKPAVSPVFTLTVYPESVQAGTVTIDVATFYPFVDGYRDTVRATGHRIEPTTVRVSIYSASDRLVRTISLGMGTGRYSIAWNGRSNAGNLQPEGVYKVRQVLTNANGSTFSSNKFVTLSMKRLVYTTQYVTKHGSSATAVGRLGNGSVTLSRATGSARLRATAPNGWAGVGYQFTLPSAAIYKSIAFQAYLKGPVSTPRNRLGMQNYKTCSPSYGWIETCFDRWVTAGTSSANAVWRTATGTVTNHRWGRNVRGMVSTNHGAVSIYKVRIKVVVGVLK